LDNVLVEISEAVVATVGVIDFVRVAIVVVFIGCSILILVFCE